MFDYLTLFCPLVLGVMGAIMAASRRWTIAFVLVGVLGAIASYVTVQSAHEDQARIQKEQREIITLQATVVNTQKELVTSQKALLELQYKAIANITGADSVAVLKAKFVGNDKQIYLWISNEGDYTLRNAVAAVSPVESPLAGMPGYASIGVRRFASLPAHSEFSAGILVEAKTYHINITADNGTIEQILKIEIIGDEIKQSAKITKDGKEISIPGLSDAPVNTPR